MCTNYTPSARHEIAALRLGVIGLPTGSWPDEVYPGYAAPIVVRNTDGSGANCVLARFGLIPRWCRDQTQASTVARGTYNARSETVASKPSFRDPWRERQWALAPMQAFFEPCWENAKELHGGRAVRWRIGRADGAPFAVAGLWERWTHPDSGVVDMTFTLLTVNADGHAVLGRMHRPDEEKRMPAIVPAHAYASWLNACPETASSLLLPMLAEELSAAPAPRVTESPNLSLF